LAARDEKLSEILAKDAVKDEEIERLRGEILVALSYRGLPNSGAARLTLAVDRPVFMLRGGAALELALASSVAHAISSARERLLTAEIRHTLARTLGRVAAR